MLISEPPNNPRENREKLVTIMIEEFKVPKLYLGNQAVMSLFATGRTTGTVLDAGEGITHAVPIYEGYAIPHAIRRIEISGADLTNYLHILLNEKYP
jgi:actin-related protein